MVSKPTIAILILVAFSSCMSNYSYKKELIQGGAQDSFISHFPDNPEMPFRTSFILKPKNNISSDEIFTIYLECKYSDSVMSFYEKNAIATYNYHDTCNIVPNILQKDMFFSKSEGLEYFYGKWIDGLANCEERYPIPNFILVGENEFERKKGISTDYELFVLESKPGKHFDDKYYGKKPIMPDAWERGYSKGVALNRVNKKAIYWFIVW